jgi:hypothetical protein
MVCADTLCDAFDVFDVACGAAGFGRDASLAFNQGGCSQ